jgi:predicted amidohydrolase
VEYQATSACGSGSCGAETKAQNVDALATFTKEAASKGAQIIVFPEYAITGFSSNGKRTWISGGYVERVPSVGTVPCNGTSEAPSLRSLSCAAIENNIAIVANLVDYVESEDAIYNTDIVLDTDGRFLAKYHKQNLWGESNMDIPKDCPLQSFTTSFGVTFGVLTCADLIYKHPALTLLGQGVRDFVVPAAWSDGMAQMQALGYAQGWSLAHCVNVILSNQPGDAESGSAILSCGKALAYTFHPGRGGVVQVSQVGGAASTLSLPAPTPASDASYNASAAIAYLRTNTNPAGDWTFSALSASAPTKACSSDGAVCCEASVRLMNQVKIDSSSSSSAASGYVLGALSGIDSDEHGSIRWAARACAVLACVGRAGQACLTYQTPGDSDGLAGVNLTLTSDTAAAIDADVDVVPEVISYGGATYPQLLLTPVCANTSGVNLDTGGFFFAKVSEGTWALNVSAAHPVTSAVIYGRNFAKDPLPYSC